MNELINAHNSNYLLMILLKELEVNNNECNL